MSSIKIRPMNPRARTRSADNRSLVSGTCYWNIRGTKSSGRVEGNKKVCDDVIGNRQGANPFSLVKDFTVQPYLDGKMYSSTGLLLREFVHYPIDLAVATVDTRTALAAPSALQQASIALQCLARTNPSEPHVEIPSFLAELKDLPEMREQFRYITSNVAMARQGLRYIPTAIQAWGTRLLRAAATGHLAYRWAIRPLVSDLQKMTEFCLAVEQRWKELGKLQKEKSIHKRIFVSRDSVSKPPVDVFLHSDLDVWKAKRYDRFTQNVWASVQWNTTGLSDIPFNGLDRLREAQKLVAGINGFGALKALWEIYPWSWFVDWFLGVGTVLSANNNTLFLTHTKSCVMVHTTSESTYQLSRSGTWSTISSMPYARQERKERFVIASPPPFDPAFLSIIDDRKWSILASLWVLDPKRRRRYGIL